ncbi:MAG: IS1595 family transposase [Roseiarcus sp.]|jgi:transposase-like protein
MPRKRIRPSQVGQKPSAVQAFSVKDFFAEFSSDDVCLTRIMEVRYGLRHVCGKCGKDSTFHKLADRRAFSCSHCGDHVYPCAGTIFQDSRTSLQTWFYAIYLFVATRHGVSGKEMQRTLGVTYKTAWRMGHQIRDLMGKVDNFKILKGHVEIDEAFFGGKRTQAEGGREAKTIIVGMKERGGRVETKIVPDVRKVTLRGVVLDHVEKGATVSTDELSSYNLLKADGYVHGAVDHSRKEWAWTDHVTGIKFSTNGIESFWKLFKDSVNGTHIHVSPQHLDRYLGEFSFRSNHRQMKNAMFDLLIAAL